MLTSKYPPFIVSKDNDDHQNFLHTMGSKESAPTSICLPLHSKENIGSLMHFFLLTEKMHQKNNVSLTVNACTFKEETLRF